jgi:hypothetical protein
VASAALSGRLSVPLEAHSAAPLIDRRTAAALGPWERPEDVFASIYRLKFVPGEPKAGNALDDVDRPLDQDPPLLNFAIPPGPLNAALAAFSKLTGVDVRIEPDLMVGRTSPGVTGLLTAEAALGRLLAGTELAHRFVEPRAAVIQLRFAGQAVEVRETLPALSSAKFTAALQDTRPAW